MVQKFFHFYLVYFLVVVFVTLYLPSLFVADFCSNYLVDMALPVPLHPAFHWPHAQLAAHDGVAGPAGFVAAAIFSPGVNPGPAPVHANVAQAGPNIYANPYTAMVSLAHILSYLFKTCVKTYNSVLCAFWLPII